jgi:hypothetical protein
MTDFNKNDYETPDWVAKAMAKMILPGDQKILEPCAGTGQILRQIINSGANYKYLHYCEINEERVKKIPIWEWQAQRIEKWIGFRGLDFLSLSNDYPGYELIITNPPFDYALEFIKKSLTLLNDKPESRLIYLLPIDTFSSKSRAAYFNELDCHISNITIIPGRIDYIKNGVPVSKTQKVVDGVLQYGKNGKPIMCSGRQVSDAIFTIKKGKGDVVSFLEI